MKITVIKNLNVRVGAPSVNAPCYDYLAPGSIIEVEDQPVSGDLYDSNNQWYKGLDGSYYWSGGATTALDADVTPANQPVYAPSNKLSYKWFKDLGIENIWKNYNEQGENVCIAVLDTGYNQSNPDLAGAVTGQLWLNYKNIPVCNTIDDLTGHGTSCISIAGARNTSAYNIGIAPKSKLLMGKVNCKNEVPGRDSVLNGIEWAIKNGADIISLSVFVEFDNDDQKSNFRSRLQQIIGTNKVLIFASAGNNSDSKPQNGENYPASFPECVSVGATNNGLFDPITLQSDCTIIHAQGISVETYDLTNAPVAKSGTSYSTPIVAGIAALAVSYCKKNNGSWNPAELLNAIYSSASPLVGKRKLIQPEMLFQQLSQKPNV